MSEIRQQIGAAFPRQRRSGGVVSYPAEQERLDEATDPAGAPRPDLPPGLALEFEPLPRRGRRPEPRPDPRSDDAADDDGGPVGHRPAPAGDPPLRDAVPGTAGAPDTAGSTGTRGGPAVPPVIRLADHMRLSDPAPPIEADPAFEAAPVFEADPAFETDPVFETDPAFEADPAFGAGTPFDAVRSVVRESVTQTQPAVVDEPVAVPDHPAATPAGAKRRRRVRLAVLAASSAAVLTAAAVGYAVLDGPDPSRTAQPSARVEVPAGNPPGAGDPGGDPQSSAEASAGVSASASARESAPVEESISAGVIVPPPIPTTAQVDPAASRSAGAAGQPSAEATRPDPPAGNPPTSPPPAEEAPEPPAVADLTARFTRTAAVLPLGLGGYVGTVRVSNPGGVDAVGWRMRLIVPGGNEVVPGPGVSVVQNGDTVFFRPQPGLATVPAGETVSFTFTVNGVLAAEPTNCSIDGNPCT